MYSLASGSDANILDRSLGIEQLLDRHDLAQAVEWVSVLLSVQHRQFVATARIPKGDPDEEPVELGLGERIGPFVLDRVLGREDDERRGSGWVTPSTVTCASSIASSNAAWVFGVARLISSARTICPKSDRAGTRIPTSAG